MCSLDGRNRANAGAMRQRQTGTTHVRGFRWWASTAREFMGDMMSGEFHDIILEARFKACPAARRLVLAANIGVALEP